jgi:diketogulonate reductase-like aldo/keto reductase
LPREEVIVATKFWMDGLGFENTLKEFDKSLKALKLDYLDLYLDSLACSQARLAVCGLLESNGEAKERGS